VITASALITAPTLPQRIRGASWPVLTHQRHSHNAAPLGRASEAMDLVTDPHLAVILINVTPAQAEHVTQRYNSGEGTQR
jgi:hypothetical protein